MKSTLHILHLEDDRHDALLVHSTLKAEGIDCVITHVENRVGFVSGLEDSGIDLVLSDYSLPAFDGLSAMAIAHASRPDLPVILVSGTLGEELAIDSMKSGATDYVLKDRLGRLGPAVRRAMKEVEERAERRQLEAQFIEAQKMEVIGQLASGLAHDFNNILAVIMGYSNMIMGSLEPDNPARKDAQQILLASERAAGLTRQLLVFSRKEIVHPVVLDLNDVLNDMDAILRALIDVNIEITIVPGAQIGRISADPGYVGQVLMNLVINARDAMPAGGKLTIATNAVTLNGSDHVVLSVRDTGCGMTEEVKTRAFEAFFTTKPGGKGTGLGLATCQTIVQKSGGHIEICSEVGKGTTFSIYFPRVEQPLDPAAIATQPSLLPRGSETLLVVEDEPSLRQLAGIVLEAQGYEVLLAANGNDGLRVAREHKGPPIRLVISDVIMPQMGGKIMAEWLKTTYPGLKILFTSGYTGDAIAEDGVLGQGVEFLSKPYTPAEIAFKVRELLDQ
jgi:signal transduction histidine kinase